VKDTIRQFKRHFHKVREAFEKLAKSGDFGLKINFQQSITGPELQAKHETPNHADTVRFVNLMRRYLNPNDTLFIKSIWTSIQLRCLSLPDATVSLVNMAIKYWETGFGKINFNGQTLTPQMVYELVCASGYFELDQESKDRIGKMKKVPILDSILMNQFHDYSIGGFKVVTILFDVLSQVDLEFGEYEPETSRNIGFCIYCRENGAFSAEEHVVPESLGNDEVVLPRGFVCDKCNHGVLSELDQYLSNFDPIAFLRVENVMYTKSGKFPAADFPTFRLEKTAPREIKLISKNGKSIFKVGEQLGEDLFQYNVTWTGRSIDWKMIGRALFKIGLGMVAFKQGRDAALDKKFDRAREFIAGGIQLDTRIVVLTKAQPNNQIHIQYYDGLPGTPFFVSIFGFVFGFCLEGAPIPTLTEELASYGFQEFSMSDEQHETT
jgi:hypothetical protein